MTEIQFNDRTPIPSSIPIGVTGDRNSQKVRFNFGRAISGSLFLKLARNDYCDKIPLSHDGRCAVWEVKSATLTNGGRVFGQLQLEGTDGSVWQTYQFSMSVSGAIPADEMIEEEYPFILIGLEQRLSLLEELGNGTPGEKGEKGDKGDPGDPGEPGEKGDKGDPGDPGQDGTPLRMLGSLEDESELPEEAQAGDCYLINGDLWTTNGEEWINAGPMQGPAGEKGDPGEPGEKGEKGDPGDPGRDGTPLRMLGSLEDESELPEEAQPGDCYLIDGDLWTTNGEEWINAGSIQGPAGEKGDKGDPGEKGDKGDKGDPGDVNCYTRDESDGRYAPIAVGNAFPFIIPTGAWVESGQMDYLFEAPVAAAGVTARDLVRADFDIGSQAAAAEAYVAAAGVTSEDMMIFYAKSVPESAIGGVYTINWAGV